MAWETLVISRVLSKFMVIWSIKTTKISSCDPTCSCKTKLFFCYNSLCTQFNMCLLKLKRWEYCNYCIYGIYLLEMKQLQYWHYLNIHRASQILWLMYSKKRCTFEWWLKNMPTMMCIYTLCFEIQSDPSTSTIVS